MAELLAQARRSGLIETPYTCAPGKNYIEIAATFSGTIPEDVCFLVAARQRAGRGWFEMFSAYHGPPGTTLAEILRRPDKDDQPRNGRLTWKWYEQLLLDSGPDQYTREVQLNGKTYRQMAIAPPCMVVSWSFTQGESGPVDAPLTYGLDVIVDDRPRPAYTLPPIGRG